MRIVFNHFTVDRLHRLLQAVATILILSGIVLTVNAKNQVVKNINDSGPGSFRQAIIDAEQGDTITFSISTNRPIVITSELIIDKSINIQGPGADLLTVSGDGSSRVSNISTNTTVFISKLTITNGNTTASGGGIYNRGDLTVVDCFFSNNSAAYGGGIYSNSPFIIYNTTFFNNQASGYGGAIEFQTGPADVINCTINSNHADGGGGAIDIYGSTVSDIDGRLNVESCTIVNNTSNNGRNGLWLLGTTRIRNTILANGTNPINNISVVAGTTTSLGYNLCQSPSSYLNESSDLVNTDPMLDPLDYYESRMPICPLTSGSPAVDAGDCGELTIDQRGIARPQGSACDIGAYELVQEPTDAEDYATQVPSDYGLEQNFPNPFNPSTKIKFVIPKSSFVNLRVYDILGNEIATLVNEEKPAGSYEITFNAPKRSSGIYFYKIQSGSFTETKKMILLR